MASGERTRSWKLPTYPDLLAHPQLGQHGSETLGMGFLVFRITLPLLFPLPPEQSPLPSGTFQPEYSQLVFNSSTNDGKSQPCSLISAALRQISCPGNLTSRYSSEPPGDLPATTTVMVSQRYSSSPSFNLRHPPISIHGKEANVLVLDE